jgi:hypothetical protein
VAGRIMAMKTSSDNIRNLNHDHLACSAVPQPSAPLNMIGLNKTPPAPIKKNYVFGYWSIQNFGRYYSDGPDRKSYS